MQFAWRYSSREYSFQLERIGAGISLLQSHGDVSRQVCAGVHPLGGGPRRSRVGGTNNWRLAVDIFENSIAPHRHGAGGSSDCRLRTTQRFQHSVVVPRARGRWRPAFLCAVDSVQSCSHRRGVGGERLSCRPPRLTDTPITRGFEPTPLNLRGESLTMASRSNCRKA
jgi:hypothetical protein